MIVFTSINTGYLDKALVLAESVKRWHPDASFHIVLADYQQGNEYINQWVDHVEYLDAFEFSQDKAFLFQHNVVELCTLLKPIYAGKLASLYASQHVIYLDPDTMLFSPLDLVKNAHQNFDVLLTPHLVSPPTSAIDIIESEYSALQHGLYNLGFFSFFTGDNAASFFNWWANRLTQICSTVKENGLFTDQKIIDIAPIYFDFIGILKDKSLNVATWNLFERPLSVNNEQFFIEDKPLVFYHFTGFDSGAGQRKIDAHNSHNPALQELWHCYHQQLNAQSSKVLGSTVWSLEHFENGSPIPHAARQYFRFGIANKADFPNPFASAFQTVWLESVGAKIYQHNANLAKNHLATINRVILKPDDEVNDVTIQVAKKLADTPQTRVFLWGFNHYAQQLEAQLYAQSLPPDNLFIIDKALAASELITELDSIEFRDSDVIVICAIKAKQEIKAWIDAQNINADILSIA
jgi:hypothetical protein